MFCELAILSYNDMSSSSSSSSSSSGDGSRSSL